MTARRTWDGCACEFCKRLDPSKTMTDEEFDAWLKAHPLDPMEQEAVERSVKNIKRRFRYEAEGPKLGL